MARRVLALTRTWLAGEWFGERGVRLPLGPLLLHGSLATALAASVRGELAPYPYAVFALSLPLALATLSLLGELAPLLRADPAADWVGALPVRPFELRLARILCIAVLLGGLSLASLLPAVLLAPPGTGGAGRLALLAAGLAQASCSAGLLLGLQALLKQRVDGVLVLVQTVLFGLLVVGTIAGLRLLPALSHCEAPTGWLACYPPALFATWIDPAARGFLPAVVGTLLATLAAQALLVAAPFPPAIRARSTRTPLSNLLTPLRRLARRCWLRPDERASFDLVYDALPAERDFVVRAYPLLAVPLAFLLLGESSQDTRAGGLASLLAFSPAIYLPVLLIHVPATATPLARWIFDSAPLDPAAEREGAIKAIAVRFLVPLYAALLLVCLGRGGLDVVLCVFGPALVSGLLTLRATYPICVSAPPLSLAVQDLPAAFGESFAGTFVTLALVQTLLALLCWRFVDSPLAGLSILVLAVLIELLRARAPRGGRTLSS